MFDLIKSFDRFALFFLISISTGNFTLASSRNLKIPSTNEYCGSLLLGVRSALSESQNLSTYDSISIHNRDEISHSISLFITNHLSEFAATSNHIGPDTAHPESRERIKTKFLSRVRFLQAKLSAPSTSILASNENLFFAVAIRGQEPIQIFWTAQDTLLAIIQHGTNSYLERVSSERRNGLFHFSPFTSLLPSIVASQRRASGVEKLRDSFRALLTSPDPKKWLYQSHFDYVPASLLNPILSAQQLSRASQDLAAIMLNEKPESAPVAIEVDQLLTFEPNMDSAATPILFVFVQLHKFEAKHFEERQSENSETRNLVQSMGNSH